MAENVLTATHPSPSGSAPGRPSDIREGRTGKLTWARNLMKNMTIQKWKRVRKRVVGRKLSAQIGHVFKRLVTSLGRLSKVGAKVEKEGEDRRTTDRYRPYSKLHADYTPIKSIYLGNIYRQESIRFVYSSRWSVKYVSWPWMWIFGVVTAGLPPVQRYTEPIGNIISFVP
jgi:hypothetical protein